MNKKRFVLVIKTGDIDVSSLPDIKRDTKSDTFKEAVYNYFLINYGGSAKNIAVDIQDDVITNEWVPEEKR